MFNEFLNSPISRRMYFRWACEGRGRAEHYYKLLGLSLALSKLSKQRRFIAPK